MHDITNIAYFQQTLHLRYMDDQGMGHSGNGSGPSLSSWLSSGYTGGQFSGGHGEVGGGHSSHSPATFTSPSPTPFDDRGQASLSLLPFPPDMNFGDPSLGGLGSNKMGTFVSNNVGIPPTSIVTSSSSSHQEPAPDLFSSRLQQQGSMAGVHKLDYGQSPAYTPSLMGYSPLGAMGHTPQAQVPPPGGHISPDFGGPAPGSGVVTKQETTFVDCHQPPSSGGQASAPSGSSGGAVSPATLAEFNQSTSKGHEILSQVYQQSSLPIRLMPVRARKYPNRQARLYCYIHLNRRIEK